METVPTEILHEILSYVPTRDLGSVRLMNHFFNTAANDRYFQTIRVPFTSTTIETLARLSRQPHVTRCVQHLIYPYRLDTWSSPSGEEIDEQRKSQDTVLREVSGIVEFALLKMSNVREITTDLDRWKLEPGSDPEDDSDEVNSIWKYTRLFQNLTSLAVYFCTNGDTSDYDCLEDDALEGRIFKFLSSAPNLKKLSLGLDWTDHVNFGYDVFPVLPLVKIFGENYVWKNLKTFYFNGGGGAMRREELTHFWARHLNTLKTFGLYQPCLETGTWREVFDFMKEEEPKLCLENLVIFEPSEGGPREPDGNRRIVYWQDGDSKELNDY
ncbi:hypothetical protein RUND412_007694, partial [Rhizina undulata]